MTKKETINGFLSLQKLAVVGVSRNSKKFGNYAFKNLKQKGLEVYAVNPNTGMIEGEVCYPNLKSLPEPVDGIIVSVPPAQTEQVVKDAFEAGIKSVWLQQGAESDEAIRYCNEKGMNAIHGECILMFSEPVKSFHRFHRGFWKLIGKYPK